VKNTLFRCVLLVGLLVEILQASPRRYASVVSPLKSVIEEIDSDDESSNVVLSPLSPPADFLFHAIEHGELDNAKKIVRGMVREGAFSPYIARAAVDTLCRSSHSKQIYHTVSPRDRKNSEIYKHNERDFISVITSEYRANVIVASQLQTRDELMKSKLAAIHNKVNRIVQNSK
jgi:hypothetical protein